MAPILSHIRTLVAFLALGLALAAPALAAPPPAGTLVPGASLGGLRLGATHEQVESEWGRAYGRCRGCLGDTWYFNYYAFRPEGAGASFERGRVSALFTLWSPAGWRTTRGLELDEPAARITAVYGPLPRTECGGYYALTLPQGRAVTAFYVWDEKLWGFGLLRRSVPVCRPG